MNKSAFAFVLMLLAISNGAFGQMWFPLSKSVEGSVISFEPSTVKDDGNYVRAWALINYDAKGSDGALSAKALYQLNCASDEYRALMITKHSGADGHGTVIFSSPYRPQDWEVVVPGGMFAEFFKQVCGFAEFQRKLEADERQNSEEHKR